MGPEVTATFTSRPGSPSKTHVATSRVSFILNVSKWMDNYQLLRKECSLSPKWNVSIKSLHPELGEPHRKGGEKSVRVRGDGGHQENKAL